MRALSVMLLASLSFGQTAVVLQLKPEDSAKVQRIHQAMLDAEKAWDAEQKEIRDKYLIVDKSDPDAAEERWYPEGEAGGFLVGTATITSRTITWSGDTQSVCETAEQKAQRIAAEDKFRAEQKKLEDEREAKSRRLRKGWVKDANCSNCGTKDFEFSPDWKYIVPKQAPPEVPYRQNLLQTVPAVFDSTINTSPVRDYGSHTQ